MSGITNVMEVGNQIDSYRIDEVPKDVVEMKRRRYRDRPQCLRSPFPFSPGDRNSPFDSS
jgi:hypothetical protein